MTVTFTDCLHSYRTANKLESHEEVCKNPDYRHIQTPEACSKILKLNNKQKSLKTSFVMYADAEFLLEKISTYDNIPKNLTQQK